MIKARLKLDSAAIANEITSRFDAHVVAISVVEFDSDDLSNIVNAIVKEYMDELDGQNLELG